MGEAADMNLPRVLSVLETLTEEELSQLNHIIVQRLKLMRQIRSHRQMMNFRLGQRVKFTSTAGEIIRGVITKYNRTSVTIATDRGGQWRVAPGFVEAE